MSETNGWPDPARPGVPLNPEQRGWHWLSCQNMPFLVFWNGEVLQDALSGQRIKPDVLSPVYSYLGPVLTPAEVDAGGSEAMKWRTAIYDALIEWHDPPRDDETPKAALRRLVHTEILAALDPAVSRPAADLVTQARRNALEEAARWHDEQEKFWMEKGREVSALDSQSGLNLLAKAAEHRKHAAAIRALKGEGDE